MHLEVIGIKDKGIERFRKEDRGKIEGLGYMEEEQSERGRFWRGVNRRTFKLEIKS
jgi:hypothetical protein